MLRLVVPGFTGSGRSRRTREPFAAPAPAFFAYLRQERGLRDGCVRVPKELSGWSVAQMQRGRRDRQIVGRNLSAEPAQRGIELSPILAELDAVTARPDVVRKLRVTPREARAVLLRIRRWADVREGRS